MITKICKTCAKEFMIVPSRNKMAKYCSYSCAGKGNIKALEAAHKACRGKPLSKSHKSKISKFMKGNKYGLKGYSISTHGYNLIYSPHHPHKNHANYVRNHRLIAEKYLNRYLEPIEQVHHINGVKSDDRPKNLFVFENNAEHIVYHKLIKYNPFLRTWLRSNIV